MSRLRSALLALAGLILMAAPALATELPIPAGSDPRLSVVLYDPLQVVGLRGVLGYQTMIEFDPAEHIENVAIGDSLGWQVIPNRRANLLFLKPMQKAPVTNMTVVTNMRRYTFELSVVRNPPGAGDRGVIYDLRFEYPAPVVPIVTRPQPPPPKPPQDVNHAYSFEGSTQNLPLRIFDDGHSTYFRFAADASVPAIFAVEADKSEAVVNFRSQDGYFVVDRLARAFVLRRGKIETRIINDGFQEAAGGPDSPPPHRKSRRLFP
jgi:type IV secretion system protein VirB9